MVLVGEVILNDLAVDEEDLSLSIGLVKYKVRCGCILGFYMRFGLEGEWMKFFLLY